MKNQQAFAWFLPLAGAVGLFACGAEQPLPQCTVGRGEHAVRYSLVSGSGVCATKRAEKVGAQIFRTPGSGIPPSLVFKPAPLAANVGKDPEHPITATGDFVSEYPSKDGVCEAPTFSEAHQRVAIPDRGLVDLRYQWSNVRVQGSATIPGTQWTADLTYLEGDCTATYKAVGLFPALKCERTEKQDGKDVVVRDPAVCKQPRPGLSIDPAFPVECEETTNLCVLAGEPPAMEP
jgi:hypothetical protein